MIKHALMMVLTMAAAVATAKPPTTSRPATPPTVAPTDPAIVKLLDAMEASGRKYLTLRADVAYSEEEVLFGDRTTYSGQVYYQKDKDEKQPARFRIHFDTSKRGRVKGKEDRDHTFFTDAKGQWYIARNARIKQMIKYHVAAPGAAVDPLKLGKGPFPMPFGQKRADVLRLFTVTTRPPKKSETPGVSYLKLVPRKNAAGTMEVKQIELWVDKDGLPVKVSTEDTAGQVAKTAKFTNIKKNIKLDAKVFDLPKPGRGWEYRIEPLPKRGPPRR